MRFDILALAVLGVGSLALAVAAEPAPATQPERAAAPAAVVSDSASAATSAAKEIPASAPAPSPATTPAAPKAATPELSPAESRLINLGYKPQMRNGEKIYCRREAPMGSRISSGQHCGTVAELEATTQVSREGLERSQRNTVNPMPH